MVRLSSATRACWLSFTSFRTLSPLDFVTCSCMVRNCVYKYNVCLCTVLSRLAEYLGFNLEQCPGISECSLQLPKFLLCLTSSEQCFWIIW